MGRMKPLRVECGHAGCQELGWYEAVTRKELSELYSKYGNGRWRCVRHTKPEEVLSLSDTRKTFEIASEQKDCGRFFGYSGFLHGPGFKIYAADFPAGTILRVTAEVIVPPVTNGDGLRKCDDRTDAEQLLRDLSGWRF